MGSTIESRQRLRALGHDEKGAPAPVRSHGHGEAEQHVVGVVGHAGRLGSDERPEQVGRIGTVGRVPAQDLDLVSFEHGDVPELGRVFADAMLHYEEARPEHLDHEAVARDGTGRTPDDEVALVAPDAQVDAGAVDGRGEASESARAERERVLEDEGLHRPPGRQEGKRDLGGVALFALKARPECGVDQRLDGPDVGRDRAGGDGVFGRRRVFPEVIRQAGGVGPSGRVEWFVHPERSMRSRAVFPKRRARASLSAHPAVGAGSGRRFVQSSTRRVPVGTSSFWPTSRVRSAITTPWVKIR